MKAKINKKIVYVVIAILFIGLFISYLLKPINFDTRLYLSEAYQADLIGSFPTNIFEAWEQKLYFNRIFFYFIYKVASILISPNNIIGFEIVVRAIYGIIAVGIITIFTKQTKNFFEKYKINQLIVFSSLYLITIFSNNIYNMQTEMTGLILLLIPIILVLKEKNIYKILAGLCISLLFFLKGVTIAYAIIVFVVMILDKQSTKSMIITIASSFSFLLLEILGIWLYKPEEILEIYLSTQYIRKEYFENQNTNYLLFNLLNSSYMIIGTIALIFNTVCNIKTKRIKLIILELLCYFILFLGIFIQKFVIVYQMAFLMPAFLLSFYIFINNIKEEKIKINIIIKVLMTIVIADSILLMIISDIAQIEKIKIEDEYKIEKIKEINQKYPDIGEKEILYIGNGYSAYFFKIKSYLKYTTTIYLANNNPKYMENDYIKNIKEKVKKYKGKYIILDDVELVNKRRISDDIIQYIEENYQVKENTGMNSRENTDEKEYVIIYERK